MGVLYKVRAVLCSVTFQCPTLCFHVGQENQKSPVTDETIETTMWIRRQGRTHPLSAEDQWTGQKCYRPSLLSSSLRFRFPVFDDKDCLSNGGFGIRRGGSVSRAQALGKVA
jgi:hypothetical protein